MRNSSFVYPLHPPLAPAETMSALMTEEYLAERARRGDRARYEAALAEAPDVEPEAEDRV